jgi:hypothetical protein
LGRSDGCLRAKGQALVCPFVYTVIFATAGADVFRSLPAPVVTVKTIVMSPLASIVASVTSRPLNSYNIAPFSSFSTHDALTRGSPSLSLKCPIKLIFPSFTSVESINASGAPTVTPARAMIGGMERIRLEVASEFVGRKESPNSSAAFIHLLFMVCSHTFKVFVYLPN